MNMELFRSKTFLKFQPYFQPGDPFVPYIAENKKSPVMSVQRAKGWLMKKEEIALKIFLSTVAKAKDWTSDDAGKAAQAYNTILGTIEIPDGGSTDFSNLTDEEVTQQYQEMEEGMKAEDGGKPKSDGPRK
jgi:hypothetical protein